MLRQFSIAGIKHTVEIVDDIDGGDTFGRFIPSGQKILLAERVKSGDIWYDQSDEMMENTLWHEILHVFQFYATTEYDESQAQVYSNFICELNKTAQHD